MPCQLPIKTWQALRTVLKVLRIAWSYCALVS